LRNDEIKRALKRLRGDKNPIGRLENFIFVPKKKVKIEKRMILYSHDSWSQTPTEDDDDDDESLINPLK